MKDFEGPACSFWAVGYVRAQLVSVILSLVVVHSEKYKYYIDVLNNNYVYISMFLSKQTIKQH